jgi:hypothetical protein
LDRELQQALDKQRDTEQKFAALVEQYKAKHAAQQDATRMTQQLMLQLEQKGTSENVTLLKMRRELHSNEKLLTQLQTKLDIQTESLGNVRVFSGSLSVRGRERAFRFASLGVRVGSCTMSGPSNGTALCWYVHDARGLRELAMQGRGVMGVFFCLISTCGPSLISPPPMFGVGG